MLIGVGIYALESITVTQVLFYLFEGVLDYSLSGGNLSFLGPFYRHTFSSLCNILCAYYGLFLFIEKEARSFKYSLECNFRIIG